MSTQPPGQPALPPAPTSSAEILALNISYWTWWTSYTNKNIVADWNAKVANWQSNYGFFASKGISDPPPPKPSIWAFNSDEFASEWNSAKLGDPPLQPTISAAFTHVPADLPDPQPPAAYIPKSPTAPTALGPAFPGDPRKFNKAPGDQTQPGYLWNAPDGHEYVLVGMATPFGPEDYWMRIS